MIYKYLDASRYQGKIDWEAVKRSGKIDGAILKTVSTNKSFGGVYIDPQFERNYSECTRLAFPWAPITTPTPRTRPPGPSSW